MALLLPEVHQAEFRRVRRRINQTLGVGAGFLRVTEGEGQEPSSGGAGTGLQVDQNHLEMLADKNEI